MKNTKRILIEQIQSMEGQGYFGVDIARELYTQGYLIQNARRALRACGYYVLDFQLADIEGLLVSSIPFFHEPVQQVIMEAEVVYWAPTIKVVRASECEEIFN